MALFGRKKQDTVLPEVDQYYEGERRDRAGLAWLLALVSVAIVALVIIGAFLGGRWLYRQVADKDSDSEVATTDTADNMPSFDGAGEDTSNDNETEETPVDDGEQEEEGRVDAPARTDTPSQPASRTPSTGGSEASDLPSTGPGDVFAIFMVVSATAGATHYAVTRKK